MIDFLEEEIGFYMGRDASELFSAWAEEADLLWVLTETHVEVRLPKDLTRRIRKLEIRTRKGSIVVESGGHGQGATFAVQLPLAAGASAAAARLESAPRPTGSPSATASRLRRWRPMQWRCWLPPPGPAMSGSC